MFAAEILIPKPMGTDGLPHLYVSNRDDSSEEGDTIAIYSLHKENKQFRGTPELRKQVRTGLRHLRGMNFGGAEDKWLIAGGVKDGGVKLFKRIKDDEGNEDLEFVTENKEIEKPTAFVWL
jgi:6-phosphogluconolactonase (cycloisomerase 2 family)